MIDKNVVYIARAKKSPSGMIHFYLNKKARLIEIHRLIPIHSNLPKPEIKTVKTYKEFIGTLGNLKNIGWRVIYYEEGEKRRILECLSPSSPNLKGD